MIHIEWGKAMFGKVDAVPGCFHIATEFFHFNRFPLVPGPTRIMFNGRGEFPGPRIPRSPKSVAVAWVRALIVLAGIVLGVRIAVLWPRPSLPLPGTEITALIAAAATLFATYRIRGLGLATYPRAVEIAEAAGLDEEMLVAVELAFGRVSAEQASETLAELRRCAAEAAALWQPEDEEEEDLRAGADPGPPRSTP